MAKDKIIRSIEEMPFMMTASDLQAAGLCGRSRAYELVNTQGFPVLKVGCKKYIPKDAFIEWYHRELEKNGFSFDV